LGFKHAPVANLISAKDEATRNMAAVCFPAYAVAALVKNNA
jgi:hypothetical protein